MAARPTVSVFSAQGESSGSLPLPAVFTAPIRLDVVQQVHSKFYSGSGRALERTMERVTKWMDRQAARIERSVRKHHGHRSRKLTPSQSPWPRTDDSHTLFPRRLVTKPPPNLGELDELSPVSPVSVVEELNDPDKPLSVTCAEVVECSPLPRPGGNGTSRSTRTKSDTLSLPLWPHLLSHLWFSLEVTELSRSKNALWSSLHQSSPLRRLELLLICSRPSLLTPTLPRSPTPERSGLERVN